MIEDKLSDFAKSQIDNALSYNEGMRQGYIQAKSEWVGLTDEEIHLIAWPHGGETMQAIIKHTILQAEKLLKEKNT